MIIVLCMYCNKVYYYKYKGFIVICPSNLSKEPEDEQLCNAVSIIINSRKPLDKIRIYRSTALHNRAKSALVMLRGSSLLSNK